MKERNLDYSERALLDITQSVKFSLLLLPRDEATDYASYLFKVAEQLEAEAQAVENAIGEGKTLEEAVSDTVLPSQPIIK